MTLIDKAEALRVVMEECYKDREMKLATRIEERIAALSPVPDAREAALHPDDMLPEAIRLIRQEASRDHSQDVVTGLKHIALLLEQLIGEDRT